MAIFNLFSRKSRGGKKSLDLSSDDPSDWDILTGDKSMSTALSTQINLGYKVNPYVFRAIDLTASACASIRPIAFDSNGNEVTKDIGALLTHPNPRQSWRQLIYEVVTNYKLNGNAYLYLIRTGLQGKERTAEIYSIPPDRIDPVKTQNLLNPVDHWIVRLGGGVLDLTPSEIIHIHTYQDINDVLGISPLSPAYLSIKQQTSAREWNTSLLEKGGKPSMQINIPDELTDEEFGRIERQANRQYNGVNNIGRTMVLDGGKTASMIGMTAQELDFNAGLIQNAREIEIALGVPSELLNDNANKTYASTQEAVKIFYNQTVIPLLTDIYDALGHYIGKEYGIDRISFDIAQIDALKGDQTALISALTAADYLSTNEKREMLNYGAVDDGEVIMTSMGKIPLAESVEPTEKLV